MMHFKKKFNPSLKLVSILTIMLFSILSIGCERQQQALPPPPIPVVSTITVSTQPVVLETELPGRTSVYKIAQIRPQISGLIQKRLFTEGSNVKTGQILYQIDPAPFQAALDGAKANLDRAQANLTSIRLRAERYKNLLAGNAVSQQNYDDAAGALKQIKADIQYGKITVKIAQINLGYCSVVAPISGRIGKSNITEGAIVTAYQPVPMATIQQLDPIYVDVPQATTELLNLKHRLQSGNLNQNGKNQDKVRLILEDGAAYPLEGTLQFSDVTVDPTTGSVILRVVVPNPEGILLPGMFIRTVIKEGINEQAILIHQQGVSRDHKGNPVALIVDADSRVAMRMLTIDQAIGNKWLVSAGLAPGDRVIVEGLMRLRPGATVKAVPFDETQIPSGSETGHGEPSKIRKDGGA